MKALIDANVLVYAGGGSDEAEPCLEILEAIAGEELAATTSTTVLEEVWHFELSGRGGPGYEGVTRRAYELFTPLLEVNDEAFAAALELSTAGLGANDRLHAATCLGNGIEAIVSADAGFDQLDSPRRIDPFDAEARRLLLSA